MSLKNKIQYTFCAIITCVILILISMYLKDQIELSNLNSMYKDIRILENQISLYYLNNNNLPIKEDSIKTFDDKSINPNDDLSNFYEIDLSKLNINDLTYGKKTKSTKDFYLINKTSHTIYYYKGIEYKNKEYYTKDIGYVKIDIEKY